MGLVLVEYSHTSVAEDAGPAWVTDALPRFNAVAVTAAGQRYTLITVHACPALSTTAPVSVYTQFFCS